MWLQIAQYNAYYTSMCISFSLPPLYDFENTLKMLTPTLIRLTWGQFYELRIYFKSIGDKSRHSSSNTLIIS